MAGRERRKAPPPLLPLHSGGGGIVGEKKEDRGAVALCKIAFFPRSFLRSLFHKLTLVGLAPDPSSNQGNKQWETEREMVFDCQQISISRLHFTKGRWRMTRKKISRKTRSEPVKFLHMYKREGES